MTLFHVLQLKFSLINKELEMRPEIPATVDIPQFDPNFLQTALSRLRVVFD
jgi:hypothetical protein